MRTHGAGTLRAEHDGTTVTLTGWVARRRDHGGVAFVDLRDASGVVQVVVRDEVLEASGAHDLRNEYCVKIIGEVAPRPAGNANPDLPTGDIEVVTAELEVLSASAPLPFQIDERTGVGEEARLKYRYLDLRRPAPAAAIRLRSEVSRVARTLLAERDFVEIETPTLTRSTPEGARDFLVPARLKPGSWYALPQSPQLFKQLLMVAGMERYYQIARCYRDEDFRADRQPEFTQLDIEMSFVEQDDLIELTEALIPAIWSLIGVRVPTPDPADHLRRGDGPLRHRQAGSALRARADRAHGLLRRDALPGLPGRLRRCRGDARRRRPAAADAGRLAGVRQATRAPRAGVRADRRGRRARRSGRQEPVRDGAVGAGGRRRSVAGGLCVLRGRSPAAGPVAARGDPAGDRPAGRADRRIRLVLPLGGGCAACSNRPTRR